MIDERTRAAIARLTENERTCLTRRLSHQTAKEMAIELGISPHAVEKRLKMARTKLGVSSSLEAARLLEASEQYGRTGPELPDLGSSETPKQEGADPVIPGPAWRRIAPYVLTGVVAMSLAIVALLAVAPLNAPEGDVAPLPQPEASDEPGNTSAETTSIVKTVGEWEAENHVVRPELAKASPETVRLYVNSAFDALDKDHSGFVERKEVPKTGVAFGTIVRKGPQPKPSERPLYADKNLSVAVIGGTAGQAAWVAIFDKDEDGKISRDEYMAKNYESYLARGLPVGWEPPGLPPAMVKAPAETVRLFLNESFDNLDRDHSGFIERAEVRAMSLGAPALAREGAPARSEASSRPGAKAPAPFISDEEAQTAWLAMFDTDADGRVNREEYMAESFERFANWGVPANWRGAPKIAGK